MSRWKSSGNYKYLAFHKPYGVLSQFSGELNGPPTLKRYFPHLPTNYYPVGRLDKDSEGLLIITNDPRLTKKFLSPNHHVPKEYLVQVDKEIDQKAIESLSQGVSIKLKTGLYKTLPCEVIKVNPPRIEDRVPPVRYRKSIPTSWIKISLREGKNRQIRKMCAAVGFPVLRLIRISINSISLNGIEIGSHKALSIKDVYPQ